MEGDVVAVVIGLDGVAVAVDDVGNIGLGGIVEDHVIDDDVVYLHAIFIFTQGALHIIGRVLGAGIFVRVLCGYLCVDEQRDMVSISYTYTASGSNSSAIVMVRTVEMEPIICVHLVKP